jgi:hypothetical protein
VADVVLPEELPVTAEVVAAFESLTFELEPPQAASEPAIAQHVARSSILLKVITVLCL